MNFIRHGVGVVEQAMGENPAIAVAVVVGALALVLFGTMTVDGYLRRRRRTRRRRAFQNHIRKLPPKETVRGRREAVSGKAAADSTGTDFEAAKPAEPNPFRSQFESPR